MRLVSELGSGTYGCVYHIREDSGQDYALKVFKRKNGGIYYSLVEIDVLFRLKSPYLLSGLELITKKQNFKVFGDDLTAVKLELMTGNLSLGFTENVLEKSLKALKDVISGLEALYRGGYYHLDIKPSNILFKADSPAIKAGEPANKASSSANKASSSANKNASSSVGKLCVLKEDCYFIADYGLCIPRVSDQDSQSLINIEIAGTHLYLPPECFSGKVHYSSCCWMLALALIQIITGKTHYSDLNLFTDDKPCFEKIAKKALSIRTKALDNFKEWFSYSGEPVELYQDLLENFELMLSINEFKRITPAQLRHKYNLEVTSIINPVKIYPCTKEPKFLTQCFMLLITVFELEHDDTLETFCLAWTYVYRLICKNRISGNNVAKILLEIKKCYELACLFYVTDNNIRYIYPEKKMINFIKELDCYLFYNPLFMNLPEKEIISLLEKCITEPEVFITAIENLSSIPHVKNGKEEISTPHFNELYLKKFSETS